MADWGHLQRSLKLASCHLLFACLVMPCPTLPILPLSPCFQGQHLLADAATLRRAATFGAASGGARALMLFRGCPRPLGSTIVLRGSNAAELRRVKRVASFAAYAAYWGVLEAALLSDQLAAAAAAVLPGNGSAQPEAVAGLADAMASTSFLATAEARARQAIVSASPHISVVLEPGAPDDALELPSPAGGTSPSSAQQQERETGENSSSSAGGAEWDEGEAGQPESPASSDSTNMWVLPAEAGAATFTVSGSQSQTEADEEPLAAPGQQAQQQEQQAEMEAGTPQSLGSMYNGPPGSPQDPLHRAAKELALQQLQLTGSDPPSPAEGLLSAAVAEQSQAGQQQHAQPPAHPGRGSDGALGAAQASQLPTAARLTVEASAASAEWGSRDGGRGTPGLAAYRSQRLWLAISCKNPAKGILCEPSHAHCMEFYADTGEQGSVGVRCGLLCSWWHVYAYGRHVKLAPSTLLDVPLLPCIPIEITAKYRMPDSRSCLPHLPACLQTCRWLHSCLLRPRPTASALTRSAAKARRCTCAASCMPTGSSRCPACACQLARSCPTAACGSGCAPAATGLQLLWLRAACRSPRRLPASPLRTC